MLNQRQKHIIQLLNERQDWIRGKELAEKLKVSDRTIRSDIDNINKNHDATVIVSDRHKGYFLCEKNTHIIEKEEKSDIPQTPEERAKFILKELLFKKKELNLYDLQENLYISESSLENDLRRVRNLCKQHADIVLVRKRNYIYLEGKEVEKRNLYKKLLEEETKGNFLNMDKLASLYSEIDLLEIKEVLVETLHDYDFHIREMSMPMLMMHVGICIERLLHHNYVQTDFKKQMLEDTVEYKIAQDFFYRISKKLQIEQVEDEMLRFALLLMGKRNNRIKREGITKDVSSMPLDEIVDRLLQQIYERFDVDMRYDSELKIGMEVHIQGVIERQKQSVKVKNVYLQETKKNYPLIFEMGIWAGNFLNQYMDFPILEDEIGFLALHLGSAYERISISKKYRALLIYPDEQLLSKLCYQKVANRFQERMDIIGHINVFEEKVVLEKDPDLLITTLPLTHELPIPTIQISLLMSSVDESKIFYALNDLDKQRNKDEFENFIKDMVYPDLFYTDLKANNYEEVIRFMCKEMENKGFAPSDFVDSVLERETFSSTSIVYGLAIPHALKVSANRSCIAVAILKQPIKWGQFDTSIVILLAIKDEDKKLMGIFFDWLSATVSDADKFHKLLEVNDYQEFLASIES